MRTIWTLAKLLIKEIFRKKDFYVAFLLMAVILFCASGLEFYDVRNVTRYLMELGLTLVFIFSVILTTALAARQYPSEIQSRTCQVLLAKPVSRAQFTLGKFLGSFLAGSACFIIFYGLFLTTVAAKGGDLPRVTVFQAFYLFLLNLAVVAAMASAFSYTFTVGANVSMTLILYLLINTYGPGLKEAGAGVLYYFLPHFEFFDLRQRLIHGWSPVSTKLIVFLTAYACTYVFIFLSMGWLKFRRQSL